MSSAKLVPISESEFIVWLQASRDNYRDENIKNGLTIEEAQKKSDEDFERYLPNGLHSLDQHIFSIKVEEILVGTLWVGVRGAVDNRKAFIYDIVLNEKARGKGYGKQAMLLLEDEVKKLGLRHIGLHVFGHNKVARNLYETIGYETTNVNMEKVLS
ncbi:MAG: GNAT family N-acetyltransferase [Bdellovibrionales bacterium]|nr:GNAT family N-acetyltransferase [Bdellovibrionales bacterium]